MANLIWCHELLGLLIWIFNRVMQEDQFVHHCWACDLQMQGADSAEDTELMHELGSAVVANTRVMLSPELKGIQNFEVHRVFLRETQEPCSSVDQPLVEYSLRGVVSLAHGVIVDSTYPDVNRDVQVRDYNVSAMAITRAS